MYSRLLLCTPVRPCRYLHDCVLYIMLLCRYSWSTIWSRAIHPDPPVELLPSGVTPYHEILGSTLLHTPVLQMLQSIHTQWTCVPLPSTALCIAGSCTHSMYVDAQGPHVVQSYPPRSTGCLLPSGVTPCNHVSHSARYVLASCRCVPYVLPYGPAQYCTSRTLRMLHILLYLCACTCSIPNPMVHPTPRCCPPIISRRWMGVALLHEILPVCTPRTLPLHTTA